VLERDAVCLDWIRSKAVKGGGEQALRHARQPFRRSCMVVVVVVVVVGERGFHCLENLPTVPVKEG